MIDNRGTWVLKQSVSLMHMLALACFLIINYFALERNFFLTIIGLVIFLVITTFSQLKALIAVAIIVSAISAVFPALAGILAVAAIIALIIKFRFLIQNWMAVLAGLIIYSYPIYIMYKDDYFYISETQHLIFCGILFQVIMSLLYLRGYSSSGALSIMGMLPLMLIIFLVPYAISDLQNAAYCYNESCYSPNPGTHAVSGHWRSTPSGGETYVDPYIRTNPDGITSNNISHR